MTVLVTTRRVASKGMTIPVLALWVFLALVQGAGPVGSAWGSRESCEESRKEAMASEDVVAISECQEVKLTPVKGTS